MTRQEIRIREAELDACLARLLGANDPAAARFVAAVLPADLRAPVARVDRQTRHVGSSGSIDLDVTLDNGIRLLCENKIDAAWSVTACGGAQPERYHRSSADLLARGVPALSVLVAPQVYIDGSRQAGRFDAVVPYETIADGLAGAEGDLVRAAILQAETPWEPVPDDRCAAFHAAYAELVAAEFPDLVLKTNPNGGATRPVGSRTIYFDAPRMLRDHDGVPRPRISVQSRDSGAGHPSAKFMIGGWAALADAAPPPETLTEIGAYLRPAGRSLGLVIDTPPLDVLAPFSPQRDAARVGLAAIDRLRRWWNAEGAVLARWRIEAAAPHTRRLEADQARPVSAEIGRRTTAPAVATPRPAPTTSRVTSPRRRTAKASGSDGWTSGRKSEPRRLLRDGVEVAVVWRQENHTATNGAVWHVTVYGETLAERYRHIEDARAAAEAHVQILGTRAAAHGTVNPPAKE